MAAPGLSQFYLPFSSFPARLEQLVRDQELPLRAQKVGEKNARIILRYGAPIGVHCELHGCLERCRDRLQGLIEQAEEQGTTLPTGAVVIAEELRASSGRFQRKWYAPRGGLWLSLALSDSLLAQFARLLPFAVGVACCETVRSFGLQQARLKWVNDLQVDSHKLAGILCETYHSQGGDRYQLIGIGLNANNSHFPPELRPIATSLQQQLGRAVDLDRLSLTLLAKLRWCIGLLHFQEERWLAGVPLNECSGIMDLWRSFSDSIGQRVVYGFDVQENPLYKALVVGVGDSGSITLELDDGSRIVENGGEISYL
jgi:BirA family biotin operon repressor/biotin-[acetyl-CoA-carboxylase] ligase